jgi:hypothetical protein
MTHYVKNLRNIYLNFSFYASSDEEAIEKAMDGIHDPYELDGHDGPWGLWRSGEKDPFWTDGILEDYR